MIEAGTKAIESRAYQGSPVPGLTFKCGIGPKVYWEVDDVCGFSRIEQDVPEGLLSIASY